MPVTDEIVAQAARNPRRPALTLAGGCLDYGTLIARATALARALPVRHANRGGDGEPLRIALLTGDNTTFVPAFLGILLAGATAVVLDPKWTAGERNRALAAARPDLLIADPPIADPPMAGLAVPTWAPGDLADAPVAASTSAEPADDEAAFLITFTAGTTATPKGVVRSHRSWLASLAAARRAFPVAAGEAVLVPGPLAHSIFLFALVEALSAGAHVHLLPRFDAEAALGVIAGNGIRRLTGVPTLYAAIAERATAGRRRFPSVTSLISAGDKLTPALRADLAQVFPCARIVEYYGAAELSFVAAGSAEDGCPAAAVGRPLPGVRISLRDDAGQEVAAGATGRLWVQSDMLATRYLDGAGGIGLREAGGWASVGDHARRDDDGWIYLVGRDGGMLISGGLNVYPAEVEAVLRTADAVADAVVLGLPDPYWGECIVAVVVPRHALRPTQADVVAHCRQRLAVYKCPKRIFVIDAMPLMPGGKIARDRLRRMLLGEAGAIAELAG